MTRKPPVAGRDGDPTDGGRLCGADKRQGSGTCRREAGWGTDHAGVGCCKLHGGSTPNQEKSGQRLLALAEAERELDKLGRRVDVGSTADAMLALVEETAANVAVYRRLLQDRKLEVGDGGIAQHTMSKAKPAEVERHVWLVLYDEERDRLFGYLAQCRKLGIEEARLEQAERLSGERVEVMAGVLRRVIDGMRDSLLRRGCDAKVIEATYREDLPAVVRAAVEAASAELPGGRAA